MDTRTKIVQFEEALSAARSVGATCVVGHFDPVTADHARRLREIRSETRCERLVVFTIDPRDALIPRRARCEVVAGMAVVDLVASASDAPDVPGAYDIRRTDLASRERLIERVRSRA